MIGRAHPSRGWICLERSEWAATMQRLREEVDRQNDPHAVGFPPAFLEWVETQMPRLAAKYPLAFQQRTDELQLQLDNRLIDIERGHLYLQPEAERIAAELSELRALMASASQSRVS